MGTTATRIGFRWKTSKSTHPTKNCQRCDPCAERCRKLPVARPPWSSSGDSAMSDKRKPIYCWDSTVLIAWKDEEQGAPLGDMDLIVSEIDKREANLLLPVTAYSEVLRAKHTPDQMDKFKS